MTDILEQDIKYLSGVGPRRSEILSKELNIHTWNEGVGDRVCALLLSRIYKDKCYIRNDRRCSS